MWPMFTGFFFTKQVPLPPEVATQEVEEVERSNDDEGKGQGYLEVQDT